MAPRRLDAGVRLLDEDDIEDLDEAPEDEVEAIGEEILDQATAARTVEELKAEIAILKDLADLAAKVRRTGDTKWNELSRVLRDDVLTPAGVAAGRRGGAPDVRRGRGGPVQAVLRTRRS